MTRINEILANVLGGMAEEVRRGGGPVKRCQRCGREHPTRRPCDLVEVMVPAKSGEMVKRQVHASRIKYEPR
jgi:hypothetical protein